MHSNSVLKVGSVTEVSGRKITVEVDKEKNTSYLIYKNSTIKNISVGSYIEIRKDFIKIIGKVEGEFLTKDNKDKYNNRKDNDSNRRLLNISLVGFIDQTDKFIGGLKELPLIGNEAFVLTEEYINKIHTLSKDNSDTIQFFETVNDSIHIHIPVNSLLCSHIAIFGNTGSGKSNTLTSLYSSLFDKYNSSNNFKNNCNFLLIDFNGEYTNNQTISTNKDVYNLSTRKHSDNKISISEKEFLNIEVLSIIASASEKTQKPFIERSIKSYNYFKNNIDLFKGTLSKKIINALSLADNTNTKLILGYLGNILNDNNDYITNLFTWHGQNQTPIYTKIEHGITNTYYANQGPEQFFTESPLKTEITNYSFPEDNLQKIIHMFYFKLIDDILSNRALNEHIAPAINKLKARENDIEKIFNIVPESNFNLFEKNNLVVINLNDVNITMKKIIPMLVSKQCYNQYKDSEDFLNIIIDEAHNILSNDSFRESESWKDYRLETFEEIIKEGRKFGVFVTISSQRPQDISETIISQAHNFFIHRLLNQKDLNTVSNAISYIDKVSQESIPTLPTGCCIFSGTATQMPLKVQVKELPKDKQPQSHTLNITSLINC